MVAVVRSQHNSICCPQSTTDCRCLVLILIPALEHETESHEQCFVTAKFSSIALPVIAGMMHAPGPAQSTWQQGATYSGHIPDLPGNTYGLPHSHGRNAQSYDQEYWLSVTGRVILKVLIAPALRCLVSCQLQNKQPESGS